MQAFIENDDDNAVPVRIVTGTVAAPQAAVDLSNTILAGGVAQTLVGAVAKPGKLEVYNDSTGDLRLALVGTASITAGFLIAPGGTYYSNGARPFNAISIWGATTGQKFVALES